MNAAIGTHKSNKSNVPQPDRQKKKNYNVKFELGLFLRQIFYW